MGRPVPFIVASGHAKPATGTSDPGAVAFGCSWASGIGAFVLFVDVGSRASGTSRSAGAGALVVASGLERGALGLSTIWVGSFESALFAEHPYTCFLDGHVACGGDNARVTSRALYGLNGVYTSWLLGK